MAFGLYYAECAQGALLFGEAMAGADRAGLPGQPLTTTLGSSARTSSAPYGSARPTCKPTYAFPRLENTSPPALILNPQFPVQLPATATGIPTAMSELKMIAFSRALMRQPVIHNVHPVWELNRSRATICPIRRPRDPCWAISGWSKSGNACEVTLQPLERGIR